MHEENTALVDGSLPAPLIDSLRELIAERTDGAEMIDLSFAQHSNDVAELRFDHGRTLMVKRGRYDWVAARFANARAASGVLRREAGIEAPAPLDLPDQLDEKPIEAYWRIEVPTLAQLWPDLGDRDRVQALESWGAMLRRVHAVRMQGWGPVAGGQKHPSLRRYLESDVHHRLLPAVHGEWPEAVAAVEAIARAVPRVAGRTAGRRPVLVHGDVHMGNILCDPAGGSPRCVGLLDLEAANTGLPENDLAIAEVLHGPLFNQALPEGWDGPVLEGYGAALNAYALQFYRAFHLANLGFFSALVGDVEHAAEVLAGLEAEVVGL